MIGCLADWFFCSVLLLSGLLVIFWLLVGGVTLTGASFVALIVRITGLLCVSGNRVFGFWMRFMVKGVMVKAIAIITAT